MLTVLYQYAAPEVAAFLKDNPSGSGMEPDRLDLVMTHINPRASISLPDCYDMEGYHLMVPHAAVPADETEEETPDDGDNPLEDASTDAFPKPNDSEEI